MGDKSSDRAAQPAAKGPQVAAAFDDDEDETADAEFLGVMQELHRLADQRLDPSANPSRRGLSLDLRDESAPPPGRLVLIGGPGQGKSTIGQFLCQVHRVALLALGPATPLPPEVRDACALIRRQCEAESLDLPAIPRFPVRVELNRFAKALAEGSTTSLFGYLRARIAALSELDVAAEDLHLWLGAYPWLLVLDGLDEVPASSNRTQVLDSVNDFVLDAHHANADLLLVATTRPQGYNDDFSPRYHRHRCLLPLDVERALHYATRLATERWGGDPDRVDRVLTRLRRAGDEPATARLMETPLQVAILTLLVDSAGEPPRERWRLFSEYYRVIYDRERQRDIPAARLLGDYAAEVDSIHQRVAKRLQSESEQAGGTDAALDETAFAALVNDRLAEEGHSEGERAALTAAIAEAALNRLVFLVAPKEGAIGFEVRSLQEFMAAQWITSGSDDAVQKRLRAIAHAAHWRNVFLFAAGRCFFQLQHLRDSIHTICCELNESEGIPTGGGLERMTLAGSRLALEILEDGSIARQPAQLKIYARLALRLIELPPCDEQRRLAARFQPGLEDVFREAIEKGLEDSLAERRLGAWRVLLPLLGQGIGWACSLAETHWPKEPDDALLVFRAEAIPENSWLTDRWAEAVPSLMPWQVRDFVRTRSEVGWLEKTPDWARSFITVDDFRRETSLRVKLEGVPGAFMLRMDPIGTREFRTTTVPDQARIEWHLAAAVWDFACKPSKQSLADALNRLADRGLDQESLTFLGFLSPWPIQGCIGALPRGADLSGLADAASRGRLGDTEDWMRAEQRWAEQGVTLEDLAYQPADSLPFDATIATCRFPAGHRGAQSSIPPPIAAFDGLMHLWRHASPLVISSIAQPAGSRIEPVPGAHWPASPPAERRRCPRTRSSFSTVCL